MDLFKLLVVVALIAEERETVCVLNHIRVWSFQSQTPCFGEDAAQEFDTLVVDACLNNVWSYGGADPVNQRRRGRVFGINTLQIFSGSRRRSPHGFNIHAYRRLVLGLAYIA